MRSYRPTKLGEPDTVFLPVIVTNAPMYKAAYDPRSVSLETGQFLTSDSTTDISEIRWIRFRKAFVPGGGDFRERTVFVVAAKTIKEFLHDLGQYSERTAPQNRVTLATSLV